MLSALAASRCFLMESRTSCLTTQAWNFGSTGPDPLASVSLVPCCRLVAFLASDLRGEGAVNRLGGPKGEKRQGLISTKCN